MPITAAESRRNNPLAKASLVCGLIPLLPTTLAAIILGIQARRQISGPARAVPRWPPPVSRWACSGLC
jgi:hypothetical protein